MSVLCNRFLGLLGTDNFLNFFFCGFQSKAVEMRTKDVATVLRWVRFMEKTSMFAVLRIDEARSSIDTE